MYTPKPIDTSDIELSGDLLALTEKIAENVHEVWSVGRISEGWTYGE
ncbi:MAG: RyR domain-containing protein, partial [Acutalibacteraceae bacterium]